VPLYPSAHQPRWLEHEIDVWLARQASRRDQPRRWGPQRQRELRNTTANCRVL